MAKSPRPWIVLPHAPIERLDDNLWAVEGTLDGGKGIPRRMMIVRRADGRLVFHNALPLDEPAMAEIGAWGEPAFLLVPNGLHRLDIHAFKARFPGMKLLCPAEVRARVAEVAEVDGGYDALPPDPGMRLEALDGVKGGEVVVVVTSGSRVSLLFGDAVMNLPHLPGLQGFLFKLLGSTGAPKVTPIGKLLMVNDKARLRAHLARLAELPGLTRLVPSHGGVVTENAPAVLREVAAGV